MRRGSRGSARRSHWTGSLQTNACADAGVWTVRRMKGCGKQAAERPQRQDRSTRSMRSQRPCLSARSAAPPTTGLDNIDGSAPPPARPSPPSAHPIRPATAQSPAAAPHGRSPALPPPLPAG
eukprot:TRINITY_DN2576_c1_g2_i4.p4 TRINITY_DN2576_c1_g2~~TRINITY_DN2576_c1_g2_i4.p4  ORF type:complete len:122 (+),score=4.95 TRINITY_DN2576_c1_g2_i4:332-697(+)